MIGSRLGLQVIGGIVVPVLIDVMDVHSARNRGAVFTLPNGSVKISTAMLVVPPMRFARRPRPSSPYQAVPGDRLCLTPEPTRLKFGELPPKRELVVVSAAKLPRGNEDGFRAIWTAAFHVFNVAYTSALVRPHNGVQLRFSVQTG